MRRTAALLLWASLVFAADDSVVFRSDVSLIRVDAQVLDDNNRAITGLRVEDFILREAGKRQEIRNFSREAMPVDILMLIDVSGSMRTHVQTLASASHRAFAVLGKDDRVAIMVFDRQTRVRLPFKSDLTAVERELDRTLDRESFNGGTDITHAMLSASDYVKREARKDARRAIVIMTDDETEFDRDEAGVGHALRRAEAVMSALIAPDAMSNRYPGGTGNYPGGGYPGGGGYPRRRGGIMIPGGGGYPGGGGGGYPGGGGGGYPGGGGGGGYPGGGGGGNYPGSGGRMGRSRTHSAGTSEIARDSGGDSFPVNDADGLENTLERIRNRYALYFYLPAGVKPGQERDIEVSLADSARRRYVSADVRYRRTYITPENGVPGPDNPVVVRASSDGITDSTQSTDGSTSSSDTNSTGLKRRRGVSDGGGPLVGTPMNDDPVKSTGSATPTTPQTITPPVPAWRRAADDPAATDSKTPATDPTDNEKRGGWRKVKPEDKSDPKPQN